MTPDDYKRAYAQQVAFGEEMRRLNRKLLHAVLNNDKPKANQIIAKATAVRAKAANADAALRQAVEQHKQANGMFELKESAIRQSEMRNQIGEAFDVHAK